MTNQAKATRLAELGASDAKILRSLASNAALTPVTSIQLGVNRIYVETDY